MTTLDDVINFVLTTEQLTDLPTIMDAITERVATEMWLVSDQWEPFDVEPTWQAPVEWEAAPAWEPLPPMAL